MLNQRTIFAHTYSFGRWVRQAVVCTAAVVALTACGGGGGSGGPEITITGDAPDTIDAATRADPTDIGTQDERLSVRDIDVFRFEIRTSGTLDIRVSGAAQTQVQVFRRDGSELPTRRVGDGVEVDVAAGDQVFVQVSAASGSGSTGTGSYRLKTKLTPDMTASSTLPTI